MSLTATPAARAGLALALALALVGCGLNVPGWLAALQASPSSKPAPAAGTPSPSFEPAAPGIAVLVGAGDIAECRDDGDEATARLLDAIDGTIFIAGDAAYDDGTPREYSECFDSSWGRHRARIRFPAPGNHDYHTDDAAGYLGYFGAAARPRGETWYSADAGAWHVIVLDSNCGDVGGCGEGSPQLEWLRADLAASRARCTVAIWHHARFSSGDEHGNDASVAPFWRVLHDAGAELVVNGHDHDYERFAPQDPGANPDPHRGIRQFVVGTGGTPLRGFDDPRANSEVRQRDAHGVLRLELAPNRYAWRFIAVEGETFGDSGTGRCH